MANILLLTHRIPFPSDKGDKIHTYQLLRHLGLMRGLLDVQVWHWLVSSGQRMLQCSQRLPQQPQLPDPSMRL